MDPFHERLARVALEAAGSYGFALAGGYAVGVVIEAYLRDGLEVQTEVLAASFARLNVRSATDSAKVELGLDWRKNKPIGLAVGPVLHADDAVANKVCALFGRAEVRDYVDVDAILASGRYTEDQLLYPCGGSRSRLRPFMVRGGTRRHRPAA